MTKISINQGDNLYDFAAESREETPVQDPLMAALIARRRAVDAACDVHDIDEVGVGGKKVKADDFFLVNPGPNPAPCTLHSANPCSEPSPCAIKSQPYILHPPPMTGCEAGCSSAAAGDGRPPKAHRAVCGERGQVHRLGCGHGPGDGGQDSARC